MAFYKREDVKGNIETLASFVNRTRAYRSRREILGVFSQLARFFRLTATHQFRGNFRDACSPRRRPKQIYSFDVLRGDRSQR